MSKPSKRPYYPTWHTGICHIVNCKWCFLSRKRGGENARDGGPYRAKDFDTSNTVFVKSEKPRQIQSLFDTEGEDSQ